MEDAPDRNREPARQATDEAAPSEVFARRFQRGDPAAVGEVRKRVGGILAHGGLSIPEAEREDLEQEVMTHLWQTVNRSRFDFTGGFWGFVEVVTARRSIDWLRRRRDETALPEGLASPARGPLGRSLERERQGLAGTVLAALEGECRELIALRLHRELSYREIAELSGKKEGALRVQFYRCIRSARRLVHRFQEEGRRTVSRGPAPPSSEDT